MTETVAALDPTSRLLLARFLFGSGIELGPGSHPMPLPFPGVSIQYVDRWEPEENHKLFTNIDEGAAFRKPDVIANLDVESLSAFAGETQVSSSQAICSSTWWIRCGNSTNVSRAQAGRRSLVFLPDRRFTFDRKRSPTPLAHLIEDHRVGATVASDEHVEDYLRKTDVWDPTWNEQDIRDRLDLTRRRSIHAHCWSKDEFLPVLEHSILEMGLAGSCSTPPSSPTPAMDSNSASCYVARLTMHLRRCLPSTSASPGRCWRPKHGSARTPIDRWRGCARCPAFRSRNAPGARSVACANQSVGTSGASACNASPNCAILTSQDLEGERRPLLPW